MSFTVKLIFDDQEINILNFSYTFRQESDYNGNPSSKPRLIWIRCCNRINKRILFNRMDD